jgi:hypothetical protein
MRFHFIDQKKASSVADTASVKLVAQFEFVY